MFRILHDGGSYRILEGEQTSPVQYRVDGQVHEPEPGTDLLAAVERMHTSGLGRELVELDLRNLAYLNATGLKALVRWVQLLRGAASLERYRLRVLANSEHDWQRTSLPDLARFAGPVLELIDRAGAAVSEPQMPIVGIAADDEPSTEGLTLGDRLK